MSTAERTTDEQDFYTGLMTTIEAGNIQRATEMIKALGGHHAQLETLTRLTRALDSTLDVRGVNTLDLDRARALIRARDRALELANHLDLAHAHALETAIDRARALYLNLDRASHINKTIIACLSAMDNAQSAVITTVPAAQSPVIALRNNVSAIITVTLMCALVCIAVAWMALLRG